MLRRLAAEKLLPCTYLKDEASSEAITTLHRPTQRGVIKGCQEKHTDLLTLIKNKSIKGKLRSENLVETCSHVAKTTELINLETEANSHSGVTKTNAVGSTPNPSPTPLSPDP